VTLGFAVVGCGSAGRRRIADLASRADARVVALCDSDPAVRAALAAAHPGLLVTDDAERAIAADGVDCAVVATPPSRHAALARAAIAAGRHVLVEKPLATVLADGERVAELARARGVALRTAATHRFFPPVARAAELIAAGALGPLRRVRARIGHDGQRLPPWARDAAQAGGGALIDNGVHLTDLVAAWGLGSRRVTLTGARDGGAVEAAGGGRIAFDDGPLCEVWASWRVRGDYLVLAAEGERASLWLRVGRATALQVRGSIEENSDWDGARFGAWERDMDAFLAEVRGAEPRGRADGVAALALVDGLYRSAAAGRPVEVVLP
jgi:predicted dehydrogenase